MSQFGVFQKAGGGGATTAFMTDAGLALPLAGVITIHGGTNITTAGAGSTVTINVTNDVNLSGHLSAGTYVAAVAGDIYATLGNIYATAGNIYATAGSVAAGTTVTGGTGVIATTGNVTATIGNLVASAWSNPATPATQRVTLSADGNVVIATPTAGALPGLTISGGGLTSTGTTTLLSLGLGAVQSTAGGVLSSSVLGVPLGGTGATTLTIHGVLVGNTVGAINATAAGAAGTILTGAGASDPVWTTATYPSTTAQGDLLLSATANTITALTKDTNATRYLSNTGVNNNAAWAQVALGTGVSGTLTVPNGGTGQNTLTIHGVLLGNAANAIGATSAGSAGQLLQAGAPGADPAWTTATYPTTTAQGDLLLSTSANTIETLVKNTTATRYLSNTGTNNNAAWAQIALATGVSGVLLPVNGGTGVSSPTIHTLPIAQGANNFNFTVLTNGQMLIGSTGADPVAATITSTGGTLNITGGAGTLNVDTNASLQTDTGWATWGGSGSYFDDTTLGSFTISRPGTGYIHNVLVSWTAPQTVTGMTAGNNYYIYVDSAGTIGKSATRSDALFQDNIVLFECLRGSSSPTNIQRTVKENHPYSYPVSVMLDEHEIIGCVIENNQGGANITLNGTRKIQINGADVLNDQGLETIIPDSGGVAVTWNQMFTNNAGKWCTHTTSDTFSSVYNSGGTITALTASKFGVYRLYVAKDNLNSSTPVYFAVINAAEYNNLTLANNAISAGNISAASNELMELELSQLGYIVYSEASNSIVQVTVVKATLKQSISTGSGTNIASLINTTTTNFDGILSAADTNVQAALETIDEWGKGATLHGVLIGRGVNQPIVAQTLTNGQLLIGNTGNDPSAATLTAGQNVTITNAAGGITITSSTGSGTNSVAVGPSTTSSNTSTIAIGYQSTSSATNAIAIGQLATASSSGSIVIGPNASCTSNQCVVIGRGATASTNIDSVVIGDGAQSSGGFTVCLGQGSNASGFVSTSIGAASGASGTDSIAIGRNAAAYSSGAIAIGAYTLSNSSGAIAIGDTASATGANGIAIGTGITAAAGKTAIKNIYATTPGAVANIALVDSTNILGTIALTNGQLLIGSTGAKPVAANITAGTNISIANGVGSMAISCITGAAHTLPVAEGSSTTNFLGPLTNGQLLIGSSGADPVAASLTAGSNITITPGAGSITIAAAVTGAATSFAGDTGTAAPAAGVLTIAGGTNVDTSAAGSTVTVISGLGSGADAVALSGVTTAATGSGTSSVAIGAGARATGDYSTSVGNLTDSTDSYTTSLGLGAHSTVFASTAIGPNAYAHGNSSIAFGNTAVASATGSIAIGKLVSSSSSGSIAIGDRATASAEYSIVIGRNSSGSIANGLFYPTALATMTTGNGVVFDPATGQMGPLTVNVQKSPVNHFVTPLDTLFGVVKWVIGSGSLPYFYTYTAANTNYWYTPYMYLNAGTWAAKAYVATATDRAIISLAYSSTGNLSPITNDTTNFGNVSGTTGAINTYKNAAEAMELVSADRTFTIPTSDYYMFKCSTPTTSGTNYYVCLQYLQFIKQ